MAFKSAYSDVTMRENSRKFVFDGSGVSSAGRQPVGGENPTISRIEWTDIRWRCDACKTKEIYHKDSKPVRCSGCKKLMIWFEFIKPFLFL